MTDNLITWNVRNWITVVLMVLLGWLVIMLAGSFFVRRTQPETILSSYVPVGAGSAS